MKTHTKSQVNMTPRLLVFAFILLGVLGATHLAGFGHGSADLATPAANPIVTPAAASPLDLAAEFLWSRQAEDGGWHSAKYGLLRSGQALTPFVLHSLLMLPEKDQDRSPQIERALAFIRRHTNEDGVLGVADPDVLEYPNYSTAYALRCLEIVGAKEDRERVMRMRAYLLAEQFAEPRGIGPQSPAFGGWGFGGPLPDGETGHMDIAHSRRVLQALRESRTEDQQVYDRAECFLRVVQRLPTGRLRPTNAADPSDLSSARIGDSATPETNGYDGGFYFSPVVLAANKGRQAHDAGGKPSGFRSYATSTCDGILSLLACNVPLDDVRLRDATNWLATHPNLDYPAGVPTDHPEPWGEAIHFYHLAARAEVYGRLHWPGAWRADMERLLVPDQRSDGSFVNQRSHLMKEDDPLLCTTLALIALSN